MADEDDPFSRPDATRLRPRPGAGKRGSKDPSRAQPPPAPMISAEPITEAVREGLGVGLNPLVQAASPLLLLAGQVRGCLQPMDVQGLRSQVLEEIRRFEDRARGAGVRTE